jgi:PAS domain S-box-containing protein
MSSPSLHFKLIDTFPLSCFFIDNEYNILYCNSLGLEMVNSRMTEIKNQSIGIHFPEIHLRIDQEGENFKTVFVDKKGQKSEVIVKYVSINDGSYYRILYVIEQSNLNQLIIEKQKFNEIILDNIPADIAVFDKNHNYLYINPNGIRDVETREWMIGKSDFDYCDYKGLDKSMAQKRRDLFNIVVETKQQIEWLDEYHRENKDIYVLRRFCPVYIDGVFIYMIGYGIDVSELKRTQNSLISNEKRNQLILNSSLDAVVIISPEGEVTFWNAQAEIIFGWKSEEVLGKILADIIVPERFRKMHEDGVKNHNAGLGGATANKIIEFPALNKNNEEFPIEFSILPIYDKGIVINYCSFIRDISFRKNKEFEICQQNKILKNQNSELEQFTYITSHDLQEPLLTLMSFSELLLDEYSGSLDAEAELYIEFINKSAIRMRALVTGLMEYARIGKRADIKKFDCNQVVSDVLNDLSVKIKNTETVILVENLPEIRGYETYIRLLFQNLISNAIKFNKENQKGIIKIICSENEKEWKFSIEDNGIGIAEKNVDQVFIIFKRLHNDSLYKGYGIGLAHCKKIVDIHNGEIYVKSKLGVGSTFSFTISKNI